MTMRWKKLGHIFVAQNISEQLCSHASNPTVLPLDKTTVRVFYSGRDLKQRSSIGFVDLSIELDKVTVLSVPKEPVLTPGETGCFDDSGVSMGCVVKNSEGYWLYYLGWNLGVTVPWRNSIGLAYSKDGLKFKRVQLSPVLDRNKVDPFSVSYPWVIIEDGIWHMWYGSNLQWGPEQRDMKHLLKYASSANGIDWIPSGEISVCFKNEAEYAMSKPCVVKDGNLYKMWYSYRGDYYRIGYAESLDGIHFQRKDDLVGIDVSSEGWDCQSICYPCVFDFGGHRYMLFNGNHYGVSGFGIARLEHN